MINKKQCSKCKEIKPVTEFHKQKTHKDGHRSHCKDCRKDKGQQRYLENKNKILNRKKEYYQNNKEKIYNYQKKQRELNREQMQAQSKLNHAKFKEEIEKPSLCSFCLEEENLDAHHPDYSKPLEVIWLCRDCHMKHHIELKRVKI